MELLTPAATGRATVRDASQGRGRIRKTDTRKGMEDLRKTRKRRVSDAWEWRQRVNRRRQIQEEKGLEGNGG